MAVPGDKFTEVYTAAWYNKVNRSIAARVGIPQAPVTTNNHYITVQNHEAVAKQAWTAVSVGLPVLNYNVALNQGAHDDWVFWTKDYDGSNYTDKHNLVILQEPLGAAAGSTARALVSGVSWLQLPITPDNLVQSRISINVIGELQYRLSGRIELIRDFALVTGGYIALVTIGNVDHGVIPIRFELLEDLDTGIADANIYTKTGLLLESAVPIRDPEGIFSVLVAGNKGIGVSYQDAFYVYNAKCPEDQ